MEEVLFTEVFNWGIGIELAQRAGWGKKIIQVTVRKVQAWQDLEDICNPK